MLKTRMTVRHYNGDVELLQGRGGIKGALRRLAEYEDTGLEAGDIAKLQEAYGYRYKSFKTIDGVWLDKLKELMAAEEDGRLVVLPCDKSPVWIVEEATHDCDAVSDKECASHPNCVGCPALKSYVRKIDEFYPTRAEAEAALKGAIDDHAECKAILP